jgi:hypothetical protein
LPGRRSSPGRRSCARANDGYFDDARVQIDHLVGNDPAHAISLGPVKAWWEGKVAGVDPAPDVVRLGLASDLEMLGITQLPKFLYGPACMHAVYDANCTLSKAAFTLTGTASGVPTTTTVPTASGALTAKAAGYFNLGVLVFTSGALTGVRRAVRDWSSNTFTLYLPLPSAPAAGDAISVYPGCARTKLDCGPTGSGGKFNEPRQLPRLRERADRRGRTMRARGDPSTDPGGDPTDPSMRPPRGDGAGGAGAGNGGGRGALPSTVPGTVSETGNPIPIAYGTVRLGLQVLERYPYSVGSQTNVWLANHAYNVGDVVIANGNVYVCTAQGTSFPEHVYPRLRDHRERRHPATRSTTRSIWRSA